MIWFIDAHKYRMALNILEIVTPRQWVMIWKNRSLPYYDFHDDVIKWKHFRRYWPFVRGIHQFPVNSLHKGQWLGALMFSLVCTRINSWLNNGEAGDLRCHRAHYDVIVMFFINSMWPSDTIWQQMWVNIGSGNGLLPDGTKPLPESVLTNHQWGLAAFISEHFHWKCSGYISLTWVWKLQIECTVTRPRDQWVKAFTPVKMEKNVASDILNACPWMKKIFRIKFLLGVIDIPWICYERSFSEFYLVIWNQLVFNQRLQLFVQSPQPSLLIFAWRN